jgi:ATP-dependent protease Clp ATPase subunit
MRALDVPFVIAIVPVWRNIFLRLLRNADYGIKKSECGFVYIDENDKSPREAQSASISRKVSGEPAQQVLLDSLTFVKIFFLSFH